MCFAIYSRKSRFTGKGESIENQVTVCRQYIESRYGKEEAQRAQVFEDEGFSGGSLDRPQFRKMIEMAEKGGIQSVVCYRLDRVSRNIGDFAGLIRRLEQWGIGFVSVREQFDTGSPMGRAMMYIASVFSQLERETIAERIRDNMMELAKTGRWLGGRTAYGYRSSCIRREEDGRVRQAYCLEEVPEELGHVRRLFQVFLRNGSLRGAEEALEGVKTRQGKKFTRFSIREILKNPVYCAADRDAWEYFSQKGAGITGDAGLYDGSGGVMAYNRTEQKKGCSHRELPVTEWIVAPGLHAPAVSGREWSQVQHILESHKKSLCEDSK